MAMGTEGRAVLVMCLEKVSRWSDVRGMDGHERAGRGSTSKGVSFNGF